MFHARPEAQIMVHGRVLPSWVTFFISSWVVFILKTALGLSEFTIREDGNC